jgi:putative oxidoreductase
MIEAYRRAKPWLQDVGLLLLRLTTGGLLAQLHGRGKFLGFAKLAQVFPDPLHIGHRASLTGAVAGELFCALLLVIGLGTRLAAAGVAFTMGVIVFVVGSGQPLAKRELGLLYFAGALVLLLTGPGRLALDTLVARRALRARRVRDARLTNALP